MEKFSMMEFVLGAVIGCAGGYVAKDKLFSNPQNDLKEKRERDELYAENEKLRSRNKEAERRIEDLVSQNERLNKAAKRTSDNTDDLQDDLEDAKNEIKKLRRQNDELLAKINEYKTACESYEIEINKLKNS